MDKLRRYFYSRPCGRGDQLLAEIAKKMAEISTHAPAGGATGWQMQLSAGSLIFLLTPLREGRRRSEGQKMQAGYFYSRPCGRGDLTPEEIKAPFTEISTHAPAGGATTTKVELVCK